MNRKILVDDNQAVSPIIATILMVAITVIMAAIIANWSA
ncbi:MAG: archaellin/type IV pilin N-terminal domain-containing protein, partial [Nitrososphaeraceae archaeon]